MSSARDVTPSPPHPLSIHRSPLATLYCAPGHLRVAFGCLCLIVPGRSQAYAQERSSANHDVVAAAVDGQPIYLREVQRLLGKVSRGQEVNPAALPVLQAQVLSEIVDRRLVLAYAQRTKSGPTAAEVDAALAELKSKLKAQGSTLERFLQEQSITEADLQRQVTWNLAWEKYLARYVTDARLEAFFKAHRREFDGSEVSVSHILLRPAAEGRGARGEGRGARDEGPEVRGQGPGARGQGSGVISAFSIQHSAFSIRRAEAIRREITSGKLSFAEAARKYSSGPSAENGGRLGFIGRQGAMVEAFSRAAFALEVGQVSELVTTQFGVHLIRCDAVKPGNRPWTEVREQLEKALARELLDRLARNQQPYTPVEFTGKAPYLKPGTRELVLP